MELITGENDKGRRLDRILRKALPECPLPLIHRLLRQGRIKVNGKPAKAQDLINCGVSIHIPSIMNTPKPAQTGYHKKTENNKPPFQQGYKSPPLEILWQDCGLMAVNKPPGLSVHGHNSLNEMVLSFLADKTPSSLSFKPGPLHRLDKPSSGIVVFSTNIEGARLFSALLRERKVKKTYLAIVEGKIDKEEIWMDELIRDNNRKKSFISQEGKNAVTRVTPLTAENGYTLIKAEISTGRTHQIRVQAAAHGHPLAGDLKYGAYMRNREPEITPRKAPQISSFFLHAWRLEFLEYTIEAPPDNIKHTPFYIQHCGVSKALKYGYENFKKLKFLEVLI